MEKDQHWIKDGETFRLKCNRCENCDVCKKRRDMFSKINIKYTSDLGFGIHDNGELIMNFGVSLNIDRYPLDHITTLSYGYTGIKEDKLFVRLEVDYWWLLPDEALDAITNSLRDLICYAGNNDLMNENKARKILNKINKNSFLQKDYIYKLYNSLIL